MMGLPCIATDCAGCDEAINNEENGLLVPVGDTRSMKEAINRIINDKEFAVRIGRAAKNSSQNYSVENVIDLWRKVI